MLLILSLLCVSLFSQPDTNAIKAYLKQNPSLSFSVQQAMKYGGIIWGMDSLQVVLVLGVPRKIEFQKNNRQMVFYYPRLYVCFGFVDGYKVRWWSRHKPK